MRIILKKIEQFIAKESLHKKSPLAYTSKELKQEIAEAEDESDFYSTMK